MNIESDHFKSLEELIDTIKMWVKNEEEYYDRWFGLNEMNILVKEIERLNNILIEIKEIINNKYWFNWEFENDEVIKEVLEKIEGVDKE